MKQNKTFFFSFSFYFTKKVTSFVRNLKQKKTHFFHWMHLSFKSEFSLWVDWSLSKFLSCFAVGVAWWQCLANSAGLLWAKVQRPEAFSVVEFAQVFLCLLCHNNVDAGDSLADNTAKMRRRKSKISLLGNSVCINLSSCDLLGKHNANGFEVMFKQFRRTFTLTFWTILMRLHRLL